MHKINKSSLKKHTYKASLGFSKTATLGDEVFYLISLYV